MVSTFPHEPEIANFNERTSSRFQWINKGSWVNQKKRKKKGREWRDQKHSLPSVEGKKRELNWGTQCSTEKERICAHKKPRMSQACKIMGPISTK
jgi:hypothetical protein